MSSQDLQNVISLIYSLSCEVMQDLGVGHRESVYHNALIVILNSRQIAHRSEVTLPIMFMNECVGMGRADLIIGNVVIEIKAVCRCPLNVSGQIKKYMDSMAGIQQKNVVGVVLNFNQNTGRVEIASSFRVFVERKSRFFINN